MSENQESSHKGKAYLKKKSVKQENFKEEWDIFLKKETYLTFDNKKRLIDKIRKLTKYPWHYRLNPKLYHEIQENRSSLQSLKRQIKNFNNRFTKQCLYNYSSFFEGKDDGLKYPLDSDQRIAVIKDDKHNLVIAEAGSGKTSVITSRIAYLVRRKDKIEKDKILALAFTRVAAQEMEQRLLKDYNIDIQISTFHALGRKIIYDETNEKPKLLYDGNEVKQYKLIEEIFTKVLEERKYQELYIDFIAYHLEQKVEEETFEDKEEYFKYLRNMRYTTLNNLSVKSIAERDIANFLFMNSIEFEYEPLVDWVNESKEDKEYHPDFYLPKYDIYIEHWGLNEEFEVPEWFSITTKEYKKSRKWKLSQFKKHKKILVETWHYEKYDNELISNLNQKLVETNPNITFTPLPYEELIEKTSEFMDKRDEIINLVASFIKIAKSNFFTVEDIAKRIKSKKYSAKQKLFGQIATEVYKRYQDILNNNNKIDFNDMINVAAEIMKKNPDKYLNMYDHILVDEFQDISYQRKELINGFVNEKSNTKLFCVGDDWQSIYQFNGSDVTFFVNFRDFFPNPELSYLNRNYRSSPQIVDTSSKLISYNKDQIKKIVYSTNPDCPKPILFIFSERLTPRQKIQPPYIHKLIEALLNEKVKPEEITVISRFNKNLKDMEVYCGARGIQIEEYAGRLRPGVRFYSAHKSKGSESTHVIITDLTSGIYGFPCEIQDSSVFELARRFEKKSFIEEERRLFYVAFTRSKKFLYLFSIENNYSMFLDEIGPYVDVVYVDSFDNWNQILSNFVIPTVNGKLGESELPVICPECGRLLREREGKYGKFLGCTGYPQCIFTFNVKEEDAISCPRCGSMLVVRKGKYGMFLGCTNYPQCDFTFNLEGRSKYYIYCPKCRKRLYVRTGKFGKFLGCAGYPDCNFAFNISNI